MPAVFRSVMKKYNLSPGDFPDIQDFQMKLSEQDFTKFHHLKQKLVDDVESVLSQDFPRLMEALPRLDAAADCAASAAISTGVAYGVPSYVPESPDWNNDADDIDEKSNPFQERESEWSLQDRTAMYKPAFASISEHGFVSAGAAKTVFESSGLDTKTLGKIWRLSEIDNDGKFDFNVRKVCWCLLLISLVFFPENNLITTLP